MAAESASSSRPATISPARLQEPPREDPEPIKKWKEEQVCIHNPPIISILKSVSEVLGKMSDSRQT